MAPKKVVSPPEAIKKKKRTRLGESSKGKAPEPSEPTPRLRTFVDAKAALDFKDLFARIILPAQRVCFNELHPEVLSVIEVQGWVSFCQITEPIYPRLVAEFVANLTIVDPPTLPFFGDFTTLVGPEFIYRIHSRVNCVNIELSVDQFASILEIPNHGIWHYAGKHWEELVTEEGTLSKADIMKDVLIGGNLSDTSTRNISINNKILMKLIRGNIHPTQGNMNNLTAMDFVLIYCFRHGIRINLIYIIFELLTNRRSQTKGSIPFGSPLTKLFRAFNCIPQDEPFKKYSKTHDLGANSLAHMYIELCDGEYVEQPSHTPRKRARQSSHPSSSSSAPPPSIDPASFLAFQNEMISQFSSLNMSMNQRFDSFTEHFDQRFTTFEAKQDQRYQEIEARHQHFDQGLDELSVEVRRVFTQLKTQESTHDDDDDDDDGDGDDDDGDDDDNADEEPNV